MVSEYMLELMKKRDRAVHEWDDRRMYNSNTARFWYGIAIMGTCFAVITIQFILSIYYFPIPSDFWTIQGPAFIAFGNSPIPINGLFLGLFFIAALYSMGSMSDYYRYKDLVDFYDKTDLERANG